MLDYLMLSLDPIFLRQAERAERWRREPQKVLFINLINNISIGDNVGFKAQERIERNKEWKKRRREEAEQMGGGGGGGGSWVGGEGRCKDNFAPLSSLSGGR